MLQSIPITGAVLSLSAAHGSAQPYLGSFAPRNDPQKSILRRAPSAQVRQDEAIDLQMQRELSELSTRGCLLIAVGSRHYIQDSRPDLVLKSLERLVQSSGSRSQSIVYATESAESFQMNAPNSKAHLVHNVHESPCIRLCDF